MKTASPIVPRKFFKRVFPLLAVLLLTPWPVAYAYTYPGNTGEPGTVRVEIAEASAAPTWSVFRRAIGGVSHPGDLFYVDATGNAADIRVNLYLTNASELIRYYRYLILNISLYVEGDAGEWERLSWHGDGSSAEAFLTLRDAQMSFDLPGYARYRVAVDDGSFYCTNTDADGNGLSPRFYLTVE